MATPVTDLNQRLQDAGFTPEQARAVAAGFEVLDRKLDEVERRLSERIDAVERRMDRLEARMDRIEDRLRIHGWLLALILAAVIAPYVERLFVTG